MKVVFTPVFVEFIPDKPDEGKLYISQKYATAVHRCACGCSQKVVTPLKAVGWKLTVDDGLVTLRPSIGNWGFPCRSHYFITRNEVQWSYDMSQREIEAGRQFDARIRQRYVEGETRVPDAAPNAGPRDQPASQGFWQRLKRKFFG